MCTSIFAATSADAQIQFAPVIVNGRTLTGPNSSAHRRGGQILIPVMSVARVLGDTVSINAVDRKVAVRRQTGSVADYDARSGRVSENGSPILTVSNAGETIFTPNADEFLLPVEIAAALFEVAIRYDNVKNMVIVARGQTQSALLTSKTKRRIAEIHQVDYEYNLNRYSAGGSQNLVVSAAGRLADGRFNFISNSSSSSLRNISLRNGTFTLDRPNGQRYIAGDIGTGTEIQFLSAYVRGASAKIPVGNATVTAFAGRAFSGVVSPVIDPLFQTDPQPVIRDRFRYDTNVFGAFATTNAGNGRRISPYRFSAGAMRFSGSKRRGDLAAGSVNYVSSRLSVQADLGVGKFAGSRSDNSRFSGTGAAVDVAGTYRVTEKLALQARYAHIGQNFLSPQSGLRDAEDLKAAGVTWSPKRWLSASLGANFSRRPGDATQDNKFVTAAFSITPNAGLPRFYVSHTQSRTSQVRSGAFTLLNASKEFSRLRLYLNATRITGIGPVSMNAQLGGNYAINDRNSIELSQGVGSRGSLNGQFDWRMSDLLGHRLSLTVGGGYSRNPTSGYSRFERLSASVVLPRQTSLQVNYYQTNQGPTMLVRLRGSLFRRKEASAFLDSPASEMNSYGKVSGRVYQDIDLNGRFDVGVDKPQAEVKVRVDGNRYVVSDENGLYRFDSVTAGDHKVYLDLLSVRADLTLLDGDGRETTLSPGTSTVYDFRLVRTGRISGRVWLDKNENGKFDEGETPLADIRVVTGSGRDTLTDADGNFTIGDLPPGEHIFVIDEKTLPEKTRAGSKPLAIQAFPGRETSDVNLSVIMIPAEIKRFGSKQP